MKTETPSADPVAVSGRELIKVWAALDANDEQQPQHDEGSPERRRLEQEHKILWTRRDALEGAVALTQAISLEGALIQIALAHGLADAVRASDDTGESRENDLRKISAALHSAASVLEDAAGCDLAELGFDIYMGNSVPPPPTGEAP